MCYNRIKLFFKLSELTHYFNLLPRKHPSNSRDIWQILALLMQHVKVQACVREVCTKQANLASPINLFCTNDSATGKHDLPNTVVKRNPAACASSSEQLARQHGCVNKHRNPY